MPWQKNQNVPETFPMFCGQISIEYNRALAVLKLSVYGILFTSTWNYIKIAYIYIKIVLLQISQKEFIKQYTQIIIFIDAKYSFLQG